MEPSMPETVQGWISFLFGEAVDDMETEHLEIMAANIWHTIQQSGDNEGILVTLTAIHKSVTQEIAYRKETE